MVIVEVQVNGGAFRLVLFNWIVEITLKQSVYFAVCISIRVCLRKWHIWTWTSIITHPHLSYFVKSEMPSYLSNRLTSINLHYSWSESCRFPSSERICFMSASYWIWISFIILFLILKVTLAFVLISSWYAGPIALASLQLLLGRSKLGCCCVGL